MILGPVNMVESLLSAPSSAIAISISCPFLCCATLGIRSDSNCTYEAKAPDSTTGSDQLMLRQRAMTIRLLMSQIEREMEMSLGWVRVLGLKGRMSAFYPGVAPSRFGTPSARLKCAEWNRGSLRVLSFLVIS